MSLVVEPMLRAAAGAVSTLHRVCFPGDSWDLRSIGQIMRIPGFFGRIGWIQDHPRIARVSTLEGEQLRQIVAVLQDPVLQGDSLTYTVKALQGEMPAKGADVSVFIDIIGMPMTPLSLAGAARRSYRRAYFR